jgi:hypothetical protein
LKRNVVLDVRGSSLHCTHVDDSDWHSALVPLRDADVGREWFAVEIPLPYLERHALAEGKPQVLQIPQRAHAAAEIRRWM